MSAAEFKEEGDQVLGKVLDRSWEVKTANGWKRVVRTVNGGFVLEGSERLNDYQNFYVARMVSRSVERIRLLRELIDHEHDRIIKTLTNDERTYDEFSNRVATSIDSAISEGRLS